MVECHVSRVNSGEVSGNEVEHAYSGLLDVPACNFLCLTPAVTASSDSVFSKYSHFLFSTVSPPTPPSFNL